METSTFWNKALQELSTDLSPEEQELWFSNITFDEMGNSTIIVTVPSEFYRDQFKRRYQKSIERKLETLSGRTYSLDYRVEKKTNQEQSSSNPVLNQAPLSSDQTEPSDVFRVNAQEILKNEFVSRRSQSGLSEDYTFSSFVIGDNNRLAAHAALSIANNPGIAYNPCLIYGKVGLGKTHLLQSIGNFILEHRPQKSIICITAEDFTNEFIQAIKENSMNTFKSKYRRRADILLIDDIHFLQKKIETQEELFHTFNALFEAKKQMVFTCDRPVSEIRDITERLQNRFTRGLIVDLKPPLVETAVAILQKKSSEKKYSVPNDVLTYICQNIRSNVRDLEAALTKVIHYANVFQKDVTIQNVKPTLLTLFNESSRKNIPIPTIQKAVSDYFSVSISELKSKNKTSKIVKPRKIAMYLSRTYNENLSYEDIGLEFGARDHTTVIHAYRSVKKMLTDDPSLPNVLEEIISSI